MTPKEKALELVDKFMEHTVEWDQVTEYAFDSEYHAKQCALIAVDEILNLDLHNVGDYKDFDTPSEWYISYWMEVKHEINNL